MEVFYLAGVKGAVKTVGMAELLGEHVNGVPDYVLNAEFIIVAQEIQPPGIPQESFHHPYDMNPRTKEVRFSDLLEAEQSKVFNRLGFTKDTELGGTLDTALRTTGNDYLVQHEPHV